HRRALRRATARRRDGPSAPEHHPATTVIHRKRFPMNIVHFVRRLLNDTRGEDYTEASSSITRAGKVAIVATVITASAGGAATLANNANYAGDTTSNKINQTVGAQSDNADKVDSPFKGK